MAQRKHLGEENTGLDLHQPSQCYMQIQLLFLNCFLLY